MKGVLWAVVTVLSIDICSLYQGESCVELQVALREANNLPSTLLSLQGQTTFSQALTLLSHVRIDGNAQLLIFNQSLTIHTSALLEMHQVRILLAEPPPPFELLFTVFGLLYMDQCALEGFSLPVMDVYGNLTVRNSTFDRNSKEVIRIGDQGAIIDLEAVQITRQIDTFLSAYLKPASIHLRNCTITSTFSPTSSAFFLFSFPTDTGPGGVWLSDVLYSGNKAAAFEMDVCFYELGINACTFAGNEGNTLTGYSTNSLVNITNSTWTHNSGLIVQFYGISGQLLISNSHFSYHSDTGFLQIAGDDVSLCLFSLSHSSFSHTNITLSAASPGVFALSDCTAQVNSLWVAGVRYVGETYTDQQALLYATSTSLLLKDLILADSGSSGMVISLVNGELDMENCTVDNPFTAQNLYIGLILVTANLRNVSIQGGDAALSQNDIFLGYIDPTYFYFMKSTVTLTHIEVSKQTLYHTGATACFFFSDFTLSHLVVRHLIQYFVVLADASSGLVTGLDVREVNLEFYVCQAASYTNLTISNATIQALAPNIRKKAIFFMSSYCHMTVFHTLLRDLAAPTVISSKSSQFDANFLTIFNCSFHELAQYPLSSHISFSNLLFEESEGGLSSGMGSQISFTDSTIGKISAEASYFRCFSSTVHLLNVSIVDYYSYLPLGYFYQNSSLWIQNSSFSAFGSIEDGRGFLLQESTLSVSNSHFSVFNVSLFQGLGISVSIANSEFRSGGSTITSLKSNNAYGGVLGCVDCGKVQITTVTVTNVSAMVGGALALQPRRGSQAVLEIEGSRFMLNSAQQGGAMYIKDASFSILNCSFLGNQAVTQGGALLASIRPSDQSLISFTIFTYNAATEGGAIKWDNVEVYLRNVSFRGNEAQYGPDLASYGVALSTRLTKLPDTPVSGQSLSLVFELLDHYGARVSLEKDKALILLSTPTVAYRGNSIAFLKSGLFPFPSLTIYAPPGSSQTITGSLSYTQGSYSLSLSGSISISFRACLPGEISLADRCEYCYSGNFSFVPSDSSCSFCPANAMCAGGSNIAVNPYYWRSGLNSSNVVRCALSGLCLGGNYSTCVEGYTGKACSQCSGQFYRLAGLKCGQCGGVAATWAHLGAIVLVAVGFIYALYRYLVISADPNTLFVLKTLIIHSQMLAATAYMRVTLPDSIGYTVHALSYLSSLCITDLPLACFDISTPETIKAVLGSLFCPMAVLLSFLFFCYRDSLNPQFPLFLLTSLLLQAPMVATLTLMPLLACNSIDSPLEWQFTDNSQQCWTTSHILLLYTLLLPGMIISVIVPIVLAITLIITKPDLYKRCFPLWISEYRVVSWELLLLLGRVVYAGLMIRGVVNDQLVQITSGFSVLILICVLNVGFQQWTYSSPDLFSLAELSLATVTVSLGLEGYMIYDYSLGSNSSEVISGLFLGLNGGFFAVCVYFLLRKRRKVYEVAAPPLPSVPNHSEVLSPSSS